MKETDSLALKLTPNSIWNALKAVNKRHIVIAGQRSNIKTTLFNKLAAGNPGYSTKVIPEDKVVLNFNNFADTTATYVIGQHSSSCGTDIMQPVVNTLDTLAELIDSYSFSSSDYYFSIDEIGCIEDSSPAFCKAINNLFNRKRVIATLCKQDTELITSIIAREDILYIDLDNIFGNTGCVIMASGLGTRFGQNKLMTSVFDKPLISHIVSTTQPLFVQSVVVTRHVSVQTFCDSINQAVILHDFPNRNDTTRLGTQYLMAQSVDNIIFFQGDQPFVSSDTIITMLLCAKNTSDKIIRLSYNGLDCAPMLFPKCFFDSLTKLPDRKGGNYIAQNHPDSIIRVEAFNEIETIDIDTPDDITKITELMHLHTLQSSLY